MIKVLHVLNHSVPFNDGYAIRSKHIVEFQKKIGIIPVVVTSPRHEPEIQSMCEIFNDIAYYRTVFKGYLWERFLCRVPFFKEYLTMSCVKHRIINVIKDNKIDIIHSHSPVLCGLPAMLVAKRYNIPFVYEARSNWEDSAVEQGKFKRGDIRYKLGRYMETEVFKESDAVITIARHLQDEIVARGIPQNKVYYIPNGVDGERFQPQDKDTELIDKYKLAGKTVVGFIGSFYAFEGLIYLIKAIPEIMKHMPDARFMIVGDGDEYQNIKNMVKNMNIEEYVYLPGRVSYEDVLRYYSIIDVLVYPRISERLTEFVTPLKPLEAMSMGKLVLGSNVGGIRELIKDGKTGILFNPEDAGSIADKCIMLLKDTDIQDRIRRNVRQVVLEERSWDVLIQKYKEVYRYVLNIATTAKYKPVQ